MIRSSALSKLETIAQLLEQLGGVAPHRIRLHPPPGTATVQDLLDLHERTERIYELVDGVLVEKVMGYRESYLACELIKLLGKFLDRHDLGILAGEAGALRLMQGLVRIPDISFISWNQLPKRQIPSDPIPDLAPDLAVEVLSEGNTPGEMRRKLKEYFLAGVRLVWLVDPGTRTVQVCTAPDKYITLTEEETLDGGDVLPSLALSLQEIFSGLPRKANGSGRTRSDEARKSGRPRKRPKDR